MIIVKAINIFLKKERKKEKPKSTKDEKAKIFIAIKNKDKKPSCKIYNRTYKFIYQIERSDLVSEWF